MSDDTRQFVDVLPPLRQDLLMQAWADLLNSLEDNVGKWTMVQRLPLTATADQLAARDAEVIRQGLGIFGLSGFEVESRDHTVWMRAIPRKGEPE